MRAPPRKATRIFVARIPPSVTEATFRGYLTFPGTFVSFLKMDKLRFGEKAYFF